MKKVYKISDETRKKMSESAFARDNTLRLKSMPKGKEHWRYTEKPSILALHKRVHRKYGSAKEYTCKCGLQAKDWAFVGNGKYTDNRDDYTPLCRKCHIALDKHHEKRDPSCYKRERDRAGKFAKAKLDKLDTRE